MNACVFFFFFSSRRRHTRYWRDWSSDVCSSDLVQNVAGTDLPTPQRSCYHHTYTLEHESTVDGQSCQISPAPFRLVLGQRVQRQHKFIDAFAGRTAYTDQGGTDVPRLEQFLHLELSQIDGLFVYGVDFRERDDTLLDT